MGLGAFSSTRGEMSIMELVVEVTRGGTHLHRTVQGRACCGSPLIALVFLSQLIVASYFSVFFVSCESLIAYKLTVYYQRRHQCAAPIRMPGLSCQLVHVARGIVDPS